jgi:hypothetical protein
MTYRNNPPRSKVFWPALAVSTLAVAFLTGCPSLTVTELDLAPGSINADQFTIQARVEVKEEDPAVDDDGNLSGGRGIVGVWLPPGWQATAARISGPQDTAFAEMAPVEDADGHFPPTFPHVPGSWFAFVSECDNIEAGVFLYDVEIDIQGDGSATAVTLGVASALFNDEGSNGPVPRELHVDLAAESATLSELPAAPASAGLAQCESIAYEEPADDSGCSCVHPGASPPGPSAARWSLLQLLRSVL